LRIGISGFPEGGMRVILSFTRMLTPIRRYSPALQAFRHLKKQRVDLHLQTCTKQSRGRVGRRTSGGVHAILLD
jgi:hypothetical protein